MLLNCGCWRRLLRVPWTTRRSNQSILKEISPEYSLEGLMRGGFLVSGCLTLSSEACISLYTFIQTKKELQNDYERIIWKWLDLGFMTEMVMISVQFSHSVMSDSGTPWTAAHQASCPSPTPRADSNSCPWSRWCHPIISSSVVPYSCLQSSPASGSLLMSQFFTSGGQSIGASMDMNLNKLQKLVMDRNFSSHGCSHCLQWFWSPRKSSLSLFPLFPHLLAIKWSDQMPWSWFLECWVFSQLYTFI